MITWVTVWVLTVSSQIDYATKSKAPYQLTYSTEKLCNQQGERIINRASQTYSCHFQQVPVSIYKGKE